jgi:nitroreductase
MAERIFNSDIMQEIQTRWSPRAFSGEQLKEEDLAALLEAARYAPSCFNEQPWRFIVAKDQAMVSKMVGLLTEQNRVWASKAPVLVMILGKKTFELNGKDNYWHMFDAGTAWGYLSLEAQRRGLITHAMGGFDKKSVYDIFEISEEYSPIAVIAIGKHGKPEDLPEDLSLREKPAGRKDLSELILK